jgi:hypothetical protein
MTSSARHEPVVHHVISGRLHLSIDVLQLIDTIRAESDACIFICGAAAKVEPRTRARLIALLDALAILASRGVRFAVGDGGTNSGVMEAAGIARARARPPFALVGVAPAAEILATRGPIDAMVDPNHSHVIAVHNPDWASARRQDGWLPSQGFWGSELEVMRDLFGRLADNRPSIAIVANGGRAALDEVRMHLDSGRGAVLVAGSGRAADALASLVRGTSPLDAETARLANKARDRGTLSAPERCEVFELRDGATALADLLQRRLSLQKTEDRSQEPGSSSS